MSKGLDLSQPSLSLTDRHSALVLIAMGVVFILSLWAVVMGGLTPPDPAAPLAMVSLLWIVVNALPTLLAWWLAAAGYGYALRQRGAAQLGVGMAALLVLNWLLLWAGALHRVAGWSLCAAGVVLLAMQLWRGLRRGTDDQNRAALLRDVPWAWVLAMPGLAMLVVAACCPPSTLWLVEAMGYDVTTYHLQVPREWLAAGGMVELEHNVYSYLPGLAEAAYAMMAAMRGGSDQVLRSIYTVQLFHASFAVLAAIGVWSWVGCSLHRMEVRQARTAGAFAGSILLAVPWVLVTGSLAYNEMVVVAMAAVALSLVVGREAPTWKTAAAIGLLAGAATLAKLTAGFTVALPAGLALMLRLIIASGWSHRKRVIAVLRCSAACAGVGVLVLLPYLARNAIWTGNPVFPFATSTFGLGHWDQSRADRWAQGHMPDADSEQRFEALWRQAFVNHGYGAVLGHDTPPERHNIARFHREGGVPVLWLLALAGAAVGWWRGRRWPVALAVGFTVWQLAWWLSMTHLQSRFLIVMVPMMCGLVGIGGGLALNGSKPGTNVARLAHGVALLVIVVMVFASGTILHHQTPRMTTEDGQPASVPLWIVIDALPQPMGTGAMTTLPMNELPRQSKIMLIGDNQPLLYVQPSVVYASAFDESPIASILREVSDPTAVARRLREQGVTHLYVGYSEIARLHQTYGFDAEVTVESMRQLTQGWPIVGQPAASTLYRVPR